MSIFQFQDRQPFTFIKNPSFHETIQFIYLSYNRRARLDKAWIRKNTCRNAR